MNQATTIKGGAAVPTISDGTGTQPYSQSVSANGTFGMKKGIHGHRTVKVA